MFLLGQAATQENEHGVGLTKALVERHGGKIMVIKKWDERRLTYEIKGQKRGTYVITYFQALANAITPLEREVKLSDDFLRVLVTRADHLNEAEMNAVEPQPIIKEERPSYDRPPFGMGGGGDRPDRGGDRGDRGGDRPRGPRRDDFQASDAGMNDKQ
jgi:small subunit ribosomal protein S6